MSGRKVVLAACLRIVMTFGEKTLEICRLALMRNLGVEPEETVLIVTDPPMRPVGELFRNAARKLTGGVELIEIPTPSVNGEEPRGFVRERMIEANVVLMPTSRSLSWTEARRSATQKGTRIASMPGITEEIIIRTFSADYKAIRKRVNRICNLMDETSLVRIITEAGTDLTLSVEGRRGRGRRGGIYDERGAWGNLPCGEAFIAPREGSAEGVYVVDAAQAGLAGLTCAITVIVENGKAVEFRGGPEAELLQAILEGVGDPQAFNLAELGIGCNDRASADSITLEAEKALGTCHIALGSNIHFGGKVDVKIHVDGVMKLPTVFFDGKKVVEAGNVVIEE